MKIMSTALSSLAFLIVSCFIGMNSLHAEEQVGKAETENIVAAAAARDFVKGRQSIFSQDGNKIVFKETPSYFYFGAYGIAIAGFFSSSTDQPALLKVLEDSCSKSLGELRVGKTDVMSFAFLQMRFGELRNGSRHLLLEDFRFINFYQRQLLSGPDYEALSQVLLDQPDRPPVETTTLTCDSDSNLVFHARVQNLGARGGGGAGSAVPLYDIRVFDAKKIELVNTPLAMTAALSQLGDERSFQAIAPRIVEKLESRQTALESFRRNIKVGDETNCGLVTEVKLPIAQVQRQSSAKWLQIDILFPKGYTNCKAPS